MAEFPSPNVPVPGQLVVDVSVEGDVTSLKLSGELDLASTPTLERELAAIEPSAGRRRVLIDLSGVGFMDSTGLQALLRARERANEHGAELVLRRGSHQVQRVFELTKTIDAFTFVD
jgi:anti-anti-sigma factor